MSDQVKASHILLMYAGSARTTELAAGSGETSLRTGNMTVSSLGTDLDRAQALLHEQVHSSLPVSGSSLFGAMGATDARIAMYQNFQLSRFAEEAVAETTAQLGTRSMSGLSFGEAIGTGSRFPFNGAYAPMSAWGITREAMGLAGGAAMVGGGLYLGSSLDPFPASGMTYTSQDPVGKYYKHN